MRTGVLGLMPYHVFQVLDTREVWARSLTSRWVYTAVRFVPRLFVKDPELRGSRKPVHAAGQGTGC